MSPTVNPSINLGYLNRHLAEIPKAGLEIVSATNEAYRKIGATLTFNCTPTSSKHPGIRGGRRFLRVQRHPLRERGPRARSNRESSQSALCAAITGLVPEYGLLLDENRHAEVLVEVKAKVETDFDYQLLGWCYPLKYSGPEVPAFAGIGEGRPPRAS